MGRQTEQLLLGQPEACSPPLLEMRGCPAALLFRKASSLSQNLLSTAKNQPSATEKHRDKSWL